MNTLLIDGGQHFGHSVGRLSHTLRQTARDMLTVLGRTVKETVTEEGYDKDTEVEEWLWMDAVVWQMPGRRMDEPWTVKKHIGGVFIADVGRNKLVVNDSRHCTNPTRSYGTGGLLHGKKHITSSIWNAPIEAFTREDDLLEGAGVDGVYLHSHKANEFLGTTRLPSFICNDATKDLQVK